MDLIIKLFGEGKDLTIYQMSLRAIVIYFIALVLIRVSGRRTFGKKSPFDNVIAIMLGAVLSRAIVGASPFVATVICSLALVLIHRLLAMLCIYNEKIAHFIKGEGSTLYKDGKIDKENLNAALMTTDDLFGDLRLKGQVKILTDVDEICMETTGEVSVIKKRTSNL